jgi:hypothetical protein
MLGSSIIGTENTGCSGPNCTYMLEFDGPSFTCANITNFDTSWTSEAAICDVDLQRQDSTNEGGNNCSWFTSYWDGMGSQLQYRAYAFNQSSVMEVVYRYFKPGIINQYSSPAEWDAQHPHQDLHDVFDIYAFRCTSWRSHYRLNISFVSGIQTILERTVTPIESVAPLDANNLISTAAIDGSTGYITQNAAEGRRASHQLQRDLVFGFIAGKAWMLARDGRFLYQDSHLQETSLVEVQQLQDGPPQLAFPVRDLMKRLVEIYENVTISMISSRQLVNAVQVDSNCTEYSTISVYWYNPPRLSLAYGITAGSAMLACVVGWVAVWANKGSGNFTFSTFLLATRNTALDRYLYGAHGLDLRNLGKVELMYGMTPSEVVGSQHPTTPRYAFGVAGEVTPLGMMELRGHV